MKSLFAQIFVFTTPIKHQSKGQNSVHWNIRRVGCLRGEGGHLSWLVGCGFSLQAFPAPLPPQAGLPQNHVEVLAQLIPLRECGNVEIPPGSPRG